MRGLLLLLTFSIYMISCSDSTTPEKKTVLVTDTVHIQDTMLVVKDSSIVTAFADSIPKGVYQGVATENPGSLISIFFTANHKYQEQMRLNNGHVIKSEGTWQRRIGEIWLNQKTALVLKFIFRRDTLFARETNGRQLDSMILVMVKRKLANESAKFSSAKYPVGDFIGIGTDPSWELQIDDKKMVSFKVADWKKPVVAGIEPATISKDSSYYIIPADNDKLIITIIPQYSSDGISDLLFDNKVVIRFKGVIYKGAGIKIKP